MCLEIDSCYEFDKRYSLRIVPVSLRFLDKTFPDKKKENALDGIACIDCA